MSFIIITILAVFFSVFVIHRFTAFSKLNLHLRPLLACALCAVTIDLALPILSIYLPDWQFPIILLITLIAAYYIAGYNSYLQGLAQAKKCRQFFPPEEQAAIINQQTMSPVYTSFPTDLASFDFSALTATLTPLVAAKPEPIIEAEPEIAAQPEPIVADEPEIAAQSEPIIADEPEITVESEPIIEVEPEIVVKPEPIIETEPDIIVEPEPIVEDEPVISEKLATLTEMNDILDYAYELQSNNQASQAILAYQKFIDYFPNDDYAPFIVIEMGNIYKAAGKYDEAVNIYNKALDLPALADNEATKKEFINNIMYLRLLKSVLQDHASQHMKFSAIPQEILQLAEEKFQQWRAKNL